MLFLIIFEVLNIMTSLMLAQHEDTPAMPIGTVGRLLQTAEISKKIP